MPTSPRSALRVAASRTLRLAVATLFAVAPASLLAQHAGRAGRAERAEPAERAASTAADAQMAGPMTAGPRMRLTPFRHPSGEDSARVAIIERAMLAHLAQYEDVRAAQADGYEQFAPELKVQRIYHFTNNRHGFRAAFSFDPARPTSLLYRKDASGSFVLAGAMYTAPARASEQDLDLRVPLGVAQWHLHTNICVPERGERERWRELENGEMRFGPAGAIASRDACDAAGGRFHDRLFGWMVHANLVRTPQGPRLSWGDDHAGH